MIEKRKKRYVIEKDFQYRFTLKLCLVGGGLLITYGGLVLYMIRLNYEMLIHNALIQMPDVVSGLQHEFRLLSLLLVAVLVLVIAFLFGLGLLLTHQIAGPLLALQARLKDIANGKKGVRLRLRRGDEFQNIANAFNNAMDHIEQKSEQK